MREIGQLPFNLKTEAVLKSIEETVMIADLNYRLVWLNPTAVSVMSKLLKLYGIDDVSKAIGMNMNRFHGNPSKQEEIMNELDSTHRVRINIKNVYVAETVITPLTGDNGEKIGYLLMLLDVTDKAKEEKNKEQLIKKLSTPILKIWDSIYALPVLGTLDNGRSDLLMHRILDTCVENQAKYFLLDLSGVTELDEFSNRQIGKISATLRLVGTTCLVVGITSKLAISLVDMDFKGETFSSIQGAIQYIMKKHDSRIQVEL